MNTEAELVELQAGVKRYKIQYPISAYTFPREARIHQVCFDDEYIHVELTDGRKLSIPLRWIPTLYNAPRDELEKYEINRRRTMIVWDPARCSINDELRIADYLCHAKADPEEGEIG
jgi:hypothetical protein